MRQLIFEGVGRLKWHEVPEPQLRGPGEALVRPIAAARCDLDAVWMTRPLGAALRIGLALHQVDGATDAISGTPPYAAPFPVGHECVAEVLEVGADVKTVCVGQRVVVPFQIACGRCGPCGRDFTSRCTAGPLRVTTYGFGNGARLHGGVLSDVVRVPYADAMLVPLPAGVDPVAVASASDNLPDAFRSVAPPLEEHPGGSVLVVGGAASSVGLYAAATAKALGATQVDYVDTRRERLEIAERLGVRALEASRTWFGKYRALSTRYAVSVDACSDSGGRGLELAVRSLDTGGFCTSAGIYPRNRTPMPLMQMYRDGIGFRTGITNSRPLIPAVLDLVRRGVLNPAPVATLVAPWNDADRAFVERTTKVVVSRVAE